VLEDDGVCVPVAVSELEGVPVLLGVDVCGCVGRCTNDTRKYLSVEMSGL